MAHPDLLTVTACPDAPEQGAVFCDLDMSAPKLAMLVRFNKAAKLLAHGLLAVADSQHGKVQREYNIRNRGRILIMNAGRATGEDNATRLEGTDFLQSP